MTSDSEQRPKATLHLGDCLDKLDSVNEGSVQLILSSPPYNIRKNYEKEGLTAEEYFALHASIAKKLVSKLSENGSICWQVGNHVKDGQLFPLDYTFYSIFSALGLKLKNRIIWRFNFGLNADKRFSGRYETVLWFVKGDDYTFNLDPVRVRQLYPGKRHSKAKGDKAGQPSGNPKGKNPADYWEFDAAAHFQEELVWDIPNVKANHPEKTDHTCQFPLELAERCILALTNENDVVLDPFVGVGTSCIAALKHGRAGIGIEKEPEFLGIAEARLAALHEGRLPMREFGKPVRRPKPTERVATVPEEWVTTGDIRGGANGDESIVANEENQEEEKVALAS